MHHLIDTSCEGCVFRIENDNKQSGCVANRLEQWKKLNLATDKGEYYLIDGYCNSCRNEEWVSRVFPDERNVSLKMLMARENARYDAIVVVPQDTKAKDVAITMEGIYAQKNKPQSITWVVYKDPRIANVIGAETVKQPIVIKWNIHENYLNLFRPICDFAFKLRSEWIWLIPVGVAFPKEEVTDLLEDSLKKRKAIFERRTSIINRHLTSHASVMCQDYEVVNYYDFIEVYRAYLSTVFPGMNLA